MEEKKYYGQQCQDDQLTKEFRELHDELVNRIIEFCNVHNIMIDEVSMKIDDIDKSIPYSSWQAPTDSSLTFMKFSDDYKDIIRGIKKVPKEEFDRIVHKQEPYLFSM